LHKQHREVIIKQF